MRSRRELREQSAQATGAAGSPPVPVSPAPNAPKPSAPATVSPAERGLASQGKEAKIPAATKAATAKVPATPVTPPRVEAEPPRGESAAPRAERESQTRARDRAALRAYKELLDPPGLSPLPSRRAIRQAQLDADRAPVTAVNMVVSAAGTSPAVVESPDTPPSPQLKKPAVKDGKAHASTLRTSTLHTGTLRTVPPAQRPPADPAATSVSASVKPAAPKPPVPASAKSGTSKPTAEAGAVRTRVGRRASSGTAVDAVGSIRPPVSGQAARIAQDAPATPAATAKSPAAGSESASAQPTPTAMAAEGVTSSHAQAQAQAQASGIPATSDNSDTRYPPLPGLTAGGSYYPVSAGPSGAALGTVAPTTEELRVLAAERAETSRAAILTQRAEARERLAQESAKNRRPALDPTSTNNLAMVTPLEFIDLPGVNRPVLRPPTTTHVPIVTRSTPRQTPAAKRSPSAQAQAPALPARPARPAEPAADDDAAQLQAKAQPVVPNVSAERFDEALAARAVHRPGPGNRPLTGGRSSTLMRAEAMATGGHPTVRPAAEPVEIHRSQMPPMPADYAHGLEPLDAMTAGLGRTKRNLLIQWGSIIVGGAALVAGAIMVLTVTLAR